MAKKNPAHMFRGKKRAYTRKKYIGGVPASRITQFDVGATTTNFPVEVTLSAQEECLVRHNALESARVTANRYIQTHAGRDGYHLKVRIYPHHVLRHNKIAQGAGADRVSQGMRCAFGKNVGTAARCKRGTTVISISTLPKNFMAAKDALRKASMKIPSPCTTKVVKGHEHLKGLV